MWLGVSLALLGAASWSCANLAIQQVGRRLGPWPTMVWAQLIGGSLVALVALLGWGPPPALTAEALALIALAAATATIAYAGLFMALARGAVAIVSPIISSWTAISAGIGVLWWHESIGVWGLVGIGAVVAGNGLVAAQKPPKSAPDRRGAMLWAAASACGFGVMVPAVNAAGALVGRLWTVPLVWLLELATIVPIMGWCGRLRVRPRSRRDWFITGRAAFFEVTGFVAVSFALGAAPVSVVSPLASLATAGSVLLGLLLLHERPGRQALGGAALASVGVVLVNLPH